MNTVLSSAQSAQVEQFRAFASEHLKPIAEKLGTREVASDDFLNKLGSQGYLGLNCPKEFAGNGSSLLELVLLVEVLAVHEPGVSLTMANHAAVIETIKRFGSDEQKSKYLPLLARGELIGSLALSEEKAGTDWKAVESTIAGGGTQLTGKKRWVVAPKSNALFLVLAKDEAGNLQLVLLNGAGSDALKTKERALMGLKSARVIDIDLDNVKIATSSVIARGEEAALHAMDVAKVVLSAGAVGLVDGATNIALEHARSREQFGSSIGQFQGVQWKLADMECERNAAKFMVYRAACALDEDYDHFRQHSSMCKWYATRVARFHSGEAMQILGAVGIEEDSAIARFYDDAKVMEIAHGTSEFQKMQLVSELNI